MIRPADIFKLFVLIAIQSVIWALLNLSQFVVLTFLPLLVLCLPTRMHPVWSMIIAFVVGLAVDFFSGSVLGITSAALLPVAFLKPLIVRFTLGGDILSRNENISVARLGLLKMFFGCLVSTGLFLVLFIWIDAAGTRSFGFNFLRLLSSLAASSVISLLMSNELCFKEASERWN